MTVDRLLEIIDKLPESTDYWTCRWFWTILAVCAIVSLIAILSWPGIMPTLTLMSGVFVAGLVIGMRRRPTSIERDVCRTS